MDNMQKGELAQLKVQQRAAEKGHVVSRPTVQARYDLVIDFGKGDLKRVQIKYGGYVPEHRASGAISVDFRRPRKRTSDEHTYVNYQSGEIDAILVYIPQVDSVVWLDAHLFHNKPSIVLRFSPPQNGQKKNINLVKDFIW